MEFDFTGSFYVEECDMKEMVRLVKLGWSPQMALNDTASGWDDSDFYLVGLVEEQIIAEIERRVKNV